MIKKKISGAPPKDDFKVEMVGNVVVVTITSVYKYQEPILIGEDKKNNPCMIKYFNNCPPWVLKRVLKKYSDGFDWDSIVKVISKDHARKTVEVFIENKRTTRIIVKSNDTINIFERR